MSSINKFIEALLFINWTKKKELKILEEDLEKTIITERESGIKYKEEIKEEENNPKKLKEIIRYHEYELDRKVDLIQHILIKINEYLYNTKEIKISKN